MPQTIILGWREWLALPDLSIPSIKAKLDTGARSSSLHVDSIDEFTRDGAAWVRFSLRPRWRSREGVDCSAPVVARRAVTDSGGHTQQRYFIRTTLTLAGQSFTADVNLACRRGMRFPMLIGRQALLSRFCIDPSRSYCCAKPPTLLDPSQ